MDSDENIQWIYENNDGTGYEYYAKGLSNLLEYIYRLYSKSSKEVKKESSSFIIPYYYVDSQGRVIDLLWEFDFVNMTQKNVKSDSIRRIIRVVNGVVWIYYKDNNRTKFDFIKSETAEYLTSLDSLRTREVQSDFDVHNKDGTVLFTCNNRSFMLTLNGSPLDKPVECPGGYKIEKLSVEQLNQLLSLRKASGASGASGSSGSSVTSTPMQQQQPVWTQHIDTASRKFYYINDSNGTSQWDPPKPPPGYSMGINEDNKKVYFYNTANPNVSHWAVGGSKSNTRKKNKRLIKRNKSYKKKRYNKRKTIKR